MEINKLKICKLWASRCSGTYFQFGISFGIRKYNLFHIIFIDKRRTADWESFYKSYYLPAAAIQVLRAKSMELTDHRNFGRIEQCTQKIFDSILATLERMTLMYFVWCLIHLCWHWFYAAGKWWIRRDELNREHKFRLFEIVWMNDRKKTKLNPKNIKETFDSRIK